MGRTPYRSRFSPPTQEDRRQVDRALNRTRTEQLADRSIEDISGGERQRVILARTVAQDTPVILLDEPTASLDVNYQIDTLELISDLATDGKTVIAAIHDLDLAARYCDSLALLADNSILATGAPGSVLTPNRLKRAFDATTVVTENPVTATPNVTSLGNQQRSTDLPERIHVLGSGSTAGSVISQLGPTQTEVTIGPLTSSSTAARTATQLGIDRIPTDPFSSLDSETLTAARDAIEESDVTVVADLEISAGNQLILDTLVDASPLVFVDTRPVASRNHAGTEARTRYENLRDRSVTADRGTLISAVSELDSKTDRSALETDD